MNMRMAISVAVAFTVAGALLGLAGLRIYRAFHPEKRDGGLLQHPERLEQMLDDTDDA